MESKIDKAKRLLERYQKDRRINVVPLTSAFDVAQKIINHTKEDKDYYQEDPALQQLFKDTVFDAWGNIIALEAEMKANTMTKEMMDILSGLASDDLRADRDVHMVSTALEEAAIRTPHSTRRCGCHARTSQGQVATGAPRTRRCTRRGPWCTRPSS